MDFGSTFINLGQGSFNARDPELRADARSAAINNALAEIARQGNAGVLYFPPGRYALERGFVVPEHVVLTLAPGAVIVPGIGTIDPATGANSADIIVRGCIEASGVQFIEPPYQTTNDSTRGEPIPGRGRLILRTNRVAEVYPEWFGATNVSSQDSYPAVQAALDAAYNDRWATEDFDPAPIPVRFRGSYYIGRPLRLGLAPDGRPLGRSRPFVLRGHQGGYQDRPTLGPVASIRTEDPSDPSLKALLRVEGATGFLIENVRLGNTGDANWVFSCLRIERVETALLPPSVPAREASPAADTLVSLVRRCAFVVADTCLVQLGRFQNPYSGEPFSPVGSRQDLGGLVFEGCYFLQYSTKGTAPDELDAARRMEPGPPLFYRDAICFCAMETRELRIDDSFFYGRVRASIRAWGGRMTLSNINFVSIQVRIPAPALAEAVARYGSIESSGVYADGSSGTVNARDNGCDIFLEYPGLGTASTAVHLRSAECQTWRHFASWPASQHPKAEYAPGDIIEEDVRCVVIQWDDATNTPLRPDEPAVVQRPPAIVWDGPPRRASGYVAAGVHVGGSYLRRSTRTSRHVALTEHLVVVGEPRGEVVDLGAREGLGGAAICVVGSDHGDDIVLNPHNALYGSPWYRYLLPLSAGG